MAVLGDYVLASGIPNISSGNPLISFAAQVSAMKIVGVGAGRNLLTAEAMDIIGNATLIYGSKRAIELAKDHIKSEGCECREIKDYSKVSELPDHAVVLSTGDPMLSGLGRFAKPGDTVVPGISSMQIASARLGVEETLVAAVTAHARDINRAREEILHELGHGKTVFLLPDPRFDLHEISRFLLDHGFSVAVAVCEKLAYPGERIRIGTTEDPPAIESDIFSVMIGDAIKGGAAGDITGDVTRGSTEDVTREHCPKTTVAVVGVLGPEGTFSEYAAKEWVNDRSEFRYFDDISEIVSSVGNGVDFGVVPTENSVEGSVGSTLDALLKCPVTIVGEIVLPIRHCLLAKNKTTPITLIKTIMSHPQAIAQCRRFLREHFSGTDIQVTASTAHAAKLASTQDGVAAIAYAETASHYGLDILFEGIQDVDENQTRFIVLGTDALPPTGNDKTSIIVALRKDRSGALHELLGEFASRNINLTKIESRPTRKALGDYLFYIDFQGHIRDESVRDALQSIRKMVATLKVLGSYPRA